MHVRAMVLAGDILFAAGVGPAPGRAAEQPRASPTPLLLAISTADGSELARSPLAAAPVLDGMAAAGGELLLALENGRLLCMQAK